jgi:hypothetical protein
LLQHVQVATSYQKAQKAIRSSYHELAARLERADKLTEAMEELQAQKNLMVWSMGGHVATFVNL